jgi:hypothetical protein
MKNLFILYPGGCGGNHLANLISTNTKFTPRFKSNNYLEDLFRDYKSKADEIYYGPKKDHLFSIGSAGVRGLKFHFAEYNNLDQLKDEDQIQILLKNDTINIFNGHEHCYVEIDSDYKNLSRMPDAFWIMISYPKENTVPYNRINLYNFTPDKERYAFPFYPSWVKPLDGGVEVDHSNGLILDSELIFTEYGSQYIRESLQPLDIDLPPIADALHEMWYNKIKEVLVLYDAFPK